MILSVLAFGGVVGACVTVAAILVGGFGWLDLVAIYYWFGVLGAAVEVAARRVLCGKLRGRNL